MEAPEVTLGKLTEQLVKPTPTQAVACQIDPKRDDMEVNLAKQCAALGLCWPRSTWPAGSRPQPWRLGRSIAEYGSEVFDCLVEAGHSPGKVWQAAGKAHTWAQSTLPQEVAVQAAEDFSEAPESGASHESQPSPNPTSLPTSGL